jgi:hypothetical protein
MSPAFRSPLEKTGMLLWPDPRWASLIRRYAKLRRIGHIEFVGFDPFSGGSA